ncbi:MAG: hypothetical protein A3I24_01445 [Candidatus Harrisonbacteria bacterium RIFCSPLOWO2_02_FULL_41_13b]|uniref:Uncharacterized protein n=1 Tax=Candidatus Harrisonbacteria bacterium RIFCSPLOWO2_02_FULL_41_13b TaxID=1798409 RepID=A0A1G1ZVQ1_9BACT|nr:MAG: hypothetical protein A3I24_01445 [Candidatus Harrisonbacteria bacterium RIFCSPLOWO2_02_FULL_41_13b]
MAVPPINGPKTDSPKNPKPKLDCFKNCKKPIKDCKTADPTIIAKIFSNLINPSFKIFTTAKASKTNSANLPKL